MKITYLISNFGAGGKERQLLFLLKEVTKVHEAQLIIFNEEIFYKEIFNLRLDLILFARKSKYSIKTITKVNTVLKKFKPDIIHTWDNISQCIALPTIIFTKKIKVINGSIRYAGQIKKPFIGKIAQKIAFNTSNVIISNSRQGLIVEKLDKSEKSATIHNGFDMDGLKDFKSKSLQEWDDNLPNFEYNVVMTGRFFSAKDYTTYINAAKLILSKNKNIGFYCIGDGPNKDDAMKLAGEWLNKHIFFSGQISNLYELLQNFDIGILLNNINGHAEGISNAIMEYMAFGLPVIATNAGGTPELVQNEKSGYLVPAFDSSVVAQKINDLLGNKEQMAKMGQEGKSIIATKFSITHMTNQYYGLYEKLLNG